MSLYDWNKDGKKDFRDDYIEYNVYKDTVGENNEYAFTGNDLLKIAAIFAIILGILGFLGWIIGLSTPKCSVSGCKNEAEENSKYCLLHKMSYDAYGNADYHEVYKNSKGKAADSSSVQSSLNSNSSLSSNSSSSTKSNYNSNSKSSNSSSYSTTAPKSSYSKSYSSSSSSTKKYDTYNSYDDGFEDVYDNEDYDWDRYLEDKDYADGVDDAMAEREFDW